MSRDRKPINLDEVSRPIKRGEQVGIILPDPAFAKKVRDGVEARCARHSLIPMSSLSNVDIKPQSIRAFNSRGGKKDMPHNAVLKVRGTCIHDIGDLSIDNSKVRAEDLPTPQPFIKRKKRKK